MPDIILVLAVWLSTVILVLTFFAGARRVSRADYSGASERKSDA